MLTLQVRDTLPLAAPPSFTPLPYTLNGAAGVDESALKTSIAILSVLDRYRLDVGKPNGQENEDLSATPASHDTFLPMIYQMVLAHDPIRMSLPAFPFKSPNTADKVLGRLPDTGEEIALAHLNGICLAIGDIYEPGARLVIVSDGLVYNDLLGVPDREVWAYGEALRAMAVEKGFKHIEFSRLQDLVHLENLPAQIDDMVYVANATNFRRALLNNHGDPNFNPSHEISSNEDTCLTYRGYLKFLRTDLRHTYLIGQGRSRSKYKSGVECIAKAMLERGAAFSKAVKARFGPSHIRLSIHPSTSGSKISIRTLPTAGPFTTPWHCSVAIDVDGTTHSAHRSEFDANPKYELIADSKGRPLDYREKSPLWTWSNNAALSISHLYPCGIMIRPAAGPETLTIADVDAAKVRALAEHNSPVILRGFGLTDKRDLYVKKAYEFGVPCPWTWGLILEIKELGMDPKKNPNNTAALSAEGMPFHYDGVFKTQVVKLDDGSEVVKPNAPRFQIFTAVTPSPKDTGYTLFTPTSLILRNLSSLSSNRGPKQLTPEILSKLRWSIRTEAFRSRNVPHMPLIEPHPTTKVPCLRYHEHWGPEKTSFDPIIVEIDDVTDQESDAIRAVLDEALRDRRNCYWHSWEKGDLLVGDNWSGLHTRSDFKAGVGRELWRIHFD
ncbi:pyoverdine dityrosine biosynthesis [Naviculisporaceae sp. PSN 640]